MKLITTALTLVLWATSAQASFIPEVVPDFQLDRYIGKWYQIASTNPFFQADCQCVTAEYVTNEAGNIDVINSCRKGSIDGELEVVVGEARTSRNPAKFRVGFGGFRSPFTNYWIVGLAEDYSYAVVSSALKNPIWILSKTPEMDETVYQEVLADLDRSFNVERLVKTTQLGCDN